MSPEPLPAVNSVRGIRRGVSALLLVLLAGCAHQAAHFDAPDASALNARRDELTAHVRDARGSIARAATAFTAAAPKLHAATESHAEETAIVEQLAPKLADLAMRVTAELRPEVDALTEQVKVLRTQDAITAENLAQADTLIAEGRIELSGTITHLQGADTSLADINGRLSPAFAKQVAELAQKANAAEQGWHESSAHVVRLQGESWFHRILGIAGALGVLAIVILYFTGRLGKAL